MEREPLKLRVTALDIVPSRQCPTPALRLGRAPNSTTSAPAMVGNWFQLHVPSGNSTTLKKGNRSAHQHSAGTSVGQRIDLPRGRGARHGTSG